MNELTGEMGYRFMPGGREEAVEIMKGFSRLKRSGLDIRVAIEESPFYRGPSAGELVPMERISELEDLVRGDKGNRSVLAVVSHERMNRIEEISRENLLSVAGGGVLFADFQKKVEGEGLFFTAVPGIESSNLTLAGLVMDGPIPGREGRFGRLRESILSIEMVTPGGESLRTGSRSVKDVSGYELSGFVTGAGGRCGMIAGITARVYPYPPTRLSLTARGERDNLNAAAVKLQEMMRPVSIELFENFAIFGGKPFLLFELHDPSSGRDDDLVSIASQIGEETKVKIEAASMHAHRFKQKQITELLGVEGAAGEAFLVSFDSGKGESHISGLPCWRSFFPGRLNILASKKEVDSGTGGGWKLIDPTVEGETPPSRVRVEVISVEGEKIVKKRAGESDAEFVPTPSAGRWKENRDALKELNGRILKVFDPEGIMIR